MRWAQRVRLLAQKIGGPGQRIGGRRAHQQVIERRPDGVQIAADIRAGALDLLQRRVSRRIPCNAAPTRQARLPECPFGEAEVEQDERAVGGLFEVLRLNIAVQHRRILAVQIGEGVE